MNDGPADDDDEELARIAGHEIGVSATTQRGAVVSLELLLDDRPEE